MVKNVLLILTILSLLVGATAEQAWSTDWDKTVTAAKQEGKVTIYTSSGPGQLAALRDGFRKAFGLDIESVSGRGAELREKLFRERQSGMYLADLFMMGASGMLLDLKPAGVLDPIKPMLVLPELVDPKAWWKGGPIYQDREQAYVIGFCFFPQPPILANTDSVKPGDIKSHADLLNPRWKGKILMNDPTTTGAGQEWFQMVSKALGLEFMKRLKNQQPVIIRDLRQQTEWVARGKYALLLGPQKAAVAELMAAGTPIEYLTTSDVNWGTSNPGNMCLINRPAHPYAVKVFINWLLSREGQTIYTKSFLIQSARLDVPTDYLDPQTLRHSGVDYVNATHEDFALELKAIAKEAKDIFDIGSK